MYQVKILLSEAFYNVSLWFFNILSYIIPKRKNYYAFYPLHDTTKFSGNLRAMIFYLIENHKDIDIVVISNNKNVRKELKEIGVKSSALFSAFSWSLLRSEFIFIDASRTTILRDAKVYVIQLWHGVGFKNIALLNDNVNQNAKRILSKFYKKYVLLITSSENDFKKKQESFKSPNIVITGSPRNDVFFSSSSYFEEIKLKYNLKKYSKIISYAPTFRDFKTTSPFSEEFWYLLQKHLEKNNEIFIVKKHPWDKYLDVPKNLANIKDLSKIIADPQELLLITDLLISDYSSITTDFTLTGKPILIYAFDLENYKNNCRSIYYNLEEVLPQPFIFDEDDLLEKIKNETWTTNSIYIESYKKFKRIFHKYNDGNSSQRVMNEVLKLSKK
ncbi:CDP-glycerol glycerophosphotransferase family protein [Aequorivita sp. KMM 9714]|uniref:CDP-glycerol glycerophosphotransferase family protein n=1 Tax=Aequorivita sp. KMM 9714 TaxID=2707173 RepID=UPI0013EB75A1|nr:CDP-glycerol glycerophosphotransferase family protein [Aequorivita sp. KMM 9714]NGX84741.1 hypothetical protein [Aequorivita sp. KMM 9714]